MNDNWVYRVNRVNSINLIILIFIFLFHSSAYGIDKTWIASGDGSSWEDQKNWLPSGAPTLFDDTIIDLKDASANVNRTFESKSIIVGGAAASSFIVNDFIRGTIAPASSSESALYIRKDGTVTLIGNGIITLKGRFKNSEETLAGEESFMFTIQ